MENRPPPLKIKIIGNGAPSEALIFCEVFGEKVIIAESNIIAE